MIAILDYGSGNLRSAQRAFELAAKNVVVTRDAKICSEASALIVPGVGAFAACMEQLAEVGGAEIIADRVSKSRPIFGICVGMQMLAKSSDEGDLPGLGWIDATVKKFDASMLRQTTRLPHMGWNDVLPIKTNSLLKNLESQARFYFLHSYYFHCNQPEDSIAVADYGINFTCAVNHEHIYGVQFHPEKSHHFGIQLLKNFSEI